jgi:hypothetical protein
MIFLKAYLTACSESITLHSTQYIFIFIALPIDCISESNVYSNECTLHSTYSEKMYAARWSPLRNEVHQRLGVGLQLVSRVRMKTVGKPLNRFLLLHLNTNTKTKAVKSDTKTKTNLRNFENELIRAELCRTRSVYEKSIRNIDT